MGIAPQLVPIGNYKLLGYYGNSNWCWQKYKISYFNSPLNSVWSLRTKTSRAPPVVVRSTARPMNCCWSLSFFDSYVYSFWRLLYPQDPAINGSLCPSHCTTMGALKVLVLSRAVATSWELGSRMMSPMGISLIQQFFIDLKTIFLVANWPNEPLEHLGLTCFLVYNFEAAWGSIITFDPCLCYLPLLSNYNTCECVVCEY